ncbi:hypothetical protein SERLA73DRAFT_184279, partial [Serpula lacrymans var. lacrymans S7.3]
MVRIRSKVSSTSVSNSAVNSSHGTSRDGSAQMVLSTKGASWNLRRGADAEKDVEGEEGPPRKKVRRENVKESLRTKLKAFASNSGRVASPEVEEEDELADDQDEIDHPHKGSKVNRQVTEATRNELEEADDSEEDDTVIAVDSGSAKAPVPQKRKISSARGRPT